MVYKRERQYHHKETPLKHTHGKHMKYHLLLMRRNSWLSGQNFQAVYQSIIESEPCKHYLILESPTCPRINELIDGKTGGTQKTKE